jgi:hypothetical protein
MGQNSRVELLGRIKGQNNRVVLLGRITGQTCRAESQVGITDKFLKFFLPMSIQT